MELSSSLFRIFMGTSLSKKGGKGEFWSFCAYSIQSIFVFFATGLFFPSICRVIGVSPEVVSRSCCSVFLFEEFSELQSLYLANSRAGETHWRQGRSRCSCLLFPDGRCAGRAGLSLGRWHQRAHENAPSNAAGRSGYTSTQGGLRRTTGSQCCCCQACETYASEQRGDEGQGARTAYRFRHS